MNSLDIIIINYNSTLPLLHCIGSLLNAADAISLSIYVHDNASSKKDDVDRLTREFPEVLLTKNPRNLGFAKAVNNALKQGSAPYVLILNPDTLVQSGLLSDAMGYMENHSDVGILGPMIFDGDGAIQGSARAFPNPLTALFGRKSILSKIFPNNPITRENILTARSDGVTPMEVDWVSGACMLVRREAVNHVGPLDDKFFMYWEDADWCRRMWQKGWKVLYYPRSSVMHYVGVSSETNIFRSVLEFHKSIYRLFGKHANAPYSLLKPLVFWGVTYRFFFVFSSQLGRKYFQRPKKHALWKSLLASREENDLRIKVLRFIARLNIGGPSIHVHLLTTGLDNRKFYSTLVTGRISPREGDMGYLFASSEEKPIIIDELQREISPLMDMKAFLKIFRVLQRENPDIVHTHTAKAGTSARLAAMIYNRFSNGSTHTVHTFHGHVFSGYFSRTKSLMFIWIERFLAKSTDVIVAISRSQKEDLSQKFRIAPAAKIKVIPLGFNLAPFLKSSPKNGRFKKSLGLCHDAFLAGIVGRLVPIKNHFLFLDMARIFLDENPHFINVKFVLVGDGELQNTLKSHAAKNGLTQHVHFCGWRRDLPDVYADLDVLALTSENEGTPVSIIEAMAAATPVISTDAGGVQDLLGPESEVSVQEGFVVCERGILCRKNDAAGFARALKHLVEMDKFQKDGMVKNAKDFVDKTFSEKRLLQDMETLYLKMMKHNLDKRDIPGWERVAG